jgi:serine/threonine protein kinase/tetratricopeptide (TPR) repeat protein
MKPAIAAGDLLGRYEIKSHLGRGGMGEVYLARDTTELKRTVAIKVLPALFAADTEVMQRFIREAQTASSLNHPNIVTIFEIGEAEGLRFIVTEFIDGETLQQRIARSRIEIDEAVDIAIQVATALSAAHKANVLHRDIKPANIMVRRDDGIVKLLDFGLAKPTEPPPSGATVETEVSSESFFETSPGVVLGTVAYMSPEQASAADVDERSDIWSLGCVLYEMVAGCLPFMAATTSEVFTLILSRAKAPPLARFVDGVPDSLEEIVGKSLSKDREERYQSFKEMLIDLKQLKRNRESGVENGSGQIASSSTGQRALQPGRNPTSSAVTVVDHPISESLKAARTQAEAAPATSSAEYLVSRIFHHKRAVAITLGAIIIGALSLSYFFYFSKNRATALTDQDTILIADFDNQTGDPIFDGTLKQGLAVQLEQSPFLSLFPNARIRQTLPLMGRSSDDRVTAEIGREICQRQGIKALIAGAIAPLGSHYVITLEAIAGRSGEVLAREQTEADSKEQVLKSLSQAASNLREKLGESLGSIQKFDAPLEEATTSSLEALKAFSIATEQSNKGKYSEAISFNKRAVEIDANFAYAYGALAAMYYNTNQPGLAAEHAAKAFGLRDRASELEKFRISNYYYTFVTGDMDKAIEVLELYKLAYPRDHRPLNSLSDKYWRIGKYEKARDAARECLKINPSNGVAYANLVQALFALGLSAETREACEQAIELKVDTPATHAFLYFLAFERGDTTAMQQQIDWANGKPEEYLGVWWQTWTAAVKGQMRRADELERHLGDLARRNGLNEVALSGEAEAVSRHAIIGDCQQVRNSLTKSGLLKEREQSLSAALSLVFCGEPVEDSVVSAIINQKANDTIHNGLWVPIFRGAIQLQRGNAAQAIQFLEVAKRYETAGQFWPQYLRGKAYLKLNRGPEAAIEFQKILEHRGQGFFSPLYPLAHLGLARAWAVAGDETKSSKAYEDFFAFWKDADPDIPILLEAKREHATKQVPSPR